MQNKQNYEILGFFALIQLLQVSEELFLVVFENTFYLMDQQYLLEFNLLLFHEVLQVIDCFRVWHIQRVEEFLPKFFSWLWVLNVNFMSVLKEVPFHDIVACILSNLQFPTFRLSMYDDELTLILSFNLIFYQVLHAIEYLFVSTYKPGFIKTVC